MKKIIVGFSRAKGFKPGSWLIMLGTGYKYSHVYFQWESKKYQETLTYEASRGMVHFTGQIAFNSSRIIVKEYEIEITEDKFDAFVKKCINLCGIKYGKLQLIGMAINTIIQKLGFKALKQNKLGFGQEQFVCSELAGALLSECLQLKLDIDLDLIEPSDIDKLLSLNNVKVLNG